jgi:ZIP family zinc transporter
VVSLSFAAVAGLGAFAGLTIFIGLPVARLKAISKAGQGLLIALATGVLIFLLWDILQHAGAPLEQALGDARHGSTGRFATLAALFAGGLAAGLLSLAYFNERLRTRVEGHAPATAGSSQPSPLLLSLGIAIGLGLHNLSEGLAIGQSGRAGQFAFFSVLVVGFALHNMTEGFGVAAPLAGQERRVSWRFLAGAGLIAGGPTFLGAVIGYLASSELLSVLFLALAAGAVISVVGELFHLMRRLSTPTMTAWGILAGFLAAYATDLLLVFGGS